MLKYLGLGAGLLAALAGLALALRSGPVSTRVSESPSSARESQLAAESYPGQASLAERVSALEDLLGAEIERRQYLEAELRAWRDLDGLPVPADAVADDVPAQQGRTTARRSRSGSLEERRGLLLDAGLAPDQVERILRRESEAQLANLEANWERQRDYLQSNAGEAAPWYANAVRDELGDVQYEAYLEAQGLPSRVAVTGVIENSPATRAGIQAGDEIRRYGGERVFTMQDLQLATISGQRGEPVLVEVVRDGALVQVTVERGPLGISGGPFGRR